VSDLLASLNISKSTLIGKGFDAGDFAQIFQQNLAVQTFRELEKMSFFAQLGIKEKPPLTNQATSKML
jgi:hypothetical protein